MLSLLALLLVLFSGALYGSVAKEINFELSLPITSCLVVICLYALGLCKVLAYGVPLILFVSIMLYGYVFVSFPLKEIMQKIKIHFLVPSFYFFLLVYIALIFGNYGKLAAGWDEFSHWMDCVKAMVYIDDFVTNPMSHSMFRFYPPGMALFQYFLQKMTLLFHESDRFCEWKAYVSYQLFLITLLLPFFASIKKNQKAQLYFCAWIVVMSPAVFWDSIYEYTYIDPFVGCVAGAMMSVVFLQDINDLLLISLGTLYGAVLVLAKDAGFFFAIFCSLAVLFQAHFSQRPWKKSILYFIPLAITILARISWILKLKLDNVPVHNFKMEHIDIIQYSKIFLFGGNATYLQTVVDNFKLAFFEMRVHAFVVQLSYFLSALLFCVVLIFIYKYLKKRDPIHAKTREGLIALLLVMMLVYTYGLGATYCSNFSEYEAVRLASYDRYMNISFSTVLLVILAGILKCVEMMNNSRLIMQCMLCVLVFTSRGAFDGFPVFMIRKDVQQSIDFRKQYDFLSEKILSSCNEKDKIFFISQESRGIDMWVTRFNCRPAYIPAGFHWSLGVPFYEGDVWTRNLDMDQWKNTLIKSEYDYVALYKVNDYFLKHYAGLFQDPKSIRDNSLFRFNRQTHQLEEVK